MVSMSESEVPGSNPLPRLSFHSCSGYQLNQLGSKAAIECHIVIDTAGYKFMNFTLLLLNDNTSTRLVPVY